jgi:hypothetical protein
MIFQVRRLRSQHPSRDKRTEPPNCAREHNFHSPTTLIPITSFGDGSHRFFSASARKFPQLIVYLPTGKANETHWHAMGGRKAASLLSPWHPRKAGRLGTYLLADANVNEDSGSSRSLRKKRFALDCAPVALTGKTSSVSRCLAHPDGDSPPERRTPRIAKRAGPSVLPVFVYT